MNTRVIQLFIFSLTYSLCLGSIGDRTQIFQNCRGNCERTNCTADGVGFQKQAENYYQQSTLEKIFQWTCADECQMGCMWLTVAAFMERGLKVPQFYGKWPFKRFLGLQEPASVLFSILNLIIHLHLLRKFRKNVAPSAPCYYLWQLFAMVCINGWVWSTIFHTRDFQITEILDYAFAYSMILTSLYCSIMRFLHKLSLVLRGFISLIFLSFYLNYFAYLSFGKFSYSLNMTLNIVTGVLTAFSWFAWSYTVRKRRPYYKLILRFYVLFGMAMSLELFDFPPLFWIIDAHSLWHLATAPIVSIFYDFLVLDCNALYKEKLSNEPNLRKLI